MAKPELGTKRTCPETGKKFYDLNRDPIVSPYTGVSYPRTYFEAGTVSARDEDEEEEKAVDSEDAAVEFVSLEDADEEAKGGDADIDDDDVDIGDDDDDTFLEEEEDGDDDIAGVIDVDAEGDEEV
jgi:uncharacterized protein (TIGR02300 family)